ncbi:MAG: phosphoethanolamine--lipid A transferase EptA [Alistipes sp.]|nr:phosphoethanolamine--lipid A transferase EptA [Alistipes sp.]
MEKISKVLLSLRHQLHRPIDVALFSFVVSLFTAIAYHAPLMRAIIGGEGSWLIIGSFVVLLVVVNFFISYLLLYLGRMVGRVMMALLTVGNALALYFIDTYEVLLTRQMMGNVFNTRYSEASSYFGLDAALYLLILGVVPAIYILLRRADYGTLRRFALSVVTSVIVVVGVVAANMNSVLWVDRHATTVGSLVLPWSYVVNSVRQYNHMQMLNRKPIMLPEATIIDDERDVVVLVIGESARSANFSLYGYERETNPLLKGDSVVALRARASATYTTEGVKAILSHKRVKEYYEPLPDYLARAGVDVLWRTTNWGEPPLHAVERYHKARDIERLYPDVDAKYDEVHLAGLGQEIRRSAQAKQLIVLHTTTSHGPEYDKRYPATFRCFTPVCTTVEMSKADRRELINAYDNTILYTDYLLHSVIEVLRSVEGVRATMIYVSDHGESLGEDNLYMHGVPLDMAPREQTDIPFIVWTSDGAPLRDDLALVGHYHVFHSILGRLAIDSPIYDASRDIFACGE